jgi:hypothetical protein
MGLLRLHALGGAPATLPASGKPHMLEDFKSKRETWMKQGVIDLEFPQN